MGLMGCVQFGQGMGHQCDVPTQPTARRLQTAVYCTSGMLLRRLVWCDVMVAQGLMGSDRKWTVLGEKV